MSELQWEAIQGHVMSYLRLTLRKDKRVERGSGLGGEQGWEGSRQASKSTRHELSGHTADLCSSRSQL